MGKYLNRPFHSGEGSPELWASSSEDSIQALGANIEVITLADDTLQMEHFFKRWLQDCNTDTEHMRIMIPSGKDSLLLKCDLQETLLNPQLLPATGQFYLSTDSLNFQATAGPGQGKSGSGQQRVPIYEMEGEKLLKLSGVCESVLFGQPLVLYPTQCWKMDWEELESNQEIFNSLNQILSERDIGLLLRRSDHSVPTTGRGQAEVRLPRGYYLVIPCRESQSMLVKPLLTRELLLPICPVSEAMGQTKSSQETMDKVNRALGSLNLSEECYNPLNQSCGLYGHLVAALSKSRPQKRQHSHLASVPQSTQDSFYPIL